MNFTRGEPRWAVFFTVLLALIAQVLPLPDWLSVVRPSVIARVIIYWSIYAPHAGGGFAPPTAQFAVAQAHALARNLLQHIEGRETTRFGHVSRGMMATTGHLKGVAQLAGLRLSGLPAWLLWRAYYLLRMPTFGRKLRIWVEWTWGMCFAADITHLRFTRTAEIDAAADSVSTSPQP